jgi:class 3 adenylate cyclase
MFTMGQLSHSALPPSNFTIAGLEEKVLLVDATGAIRYANTGMAELLGAPDKHVLLRSQLADWDGKGLLPRGFLSALVEATRIADRSGMADHEFPVGQGPAALAGASPMASNPGGQQRVRLRFVASPVEGRVQVIVQDVTYVHWIEHTFKRYVSPAVLDQLKAVPQDELRRVERRRVSVLFTDLRGFSRLCQEEAPDSVCILLNQHFQHVVEAVQRHDGTVDKLIGDSVMAIFGAPLATTKHALQALLAAADILHEHNAWIERRVAAGWPTLAVSIGIATGDVVVGNVGTLERMDFTVLGHTVNLASRLVGEAKAGQILTEPATHRAAQQSIADLAAAGGAANLPHMGFSAIGTLSLKNISDPVDVLAVRV